MDFEDIESEINDLLSIRHPADKITPDRVKSATTLSFKSSRWVPYFVYDIVSGKVVKKLDGYIGGFGEMPNDNVGYYLKQDGSFTNDPNEAGDFPDAQILEYNDDFDI